MSVSNRKYCLCKVGSLDFVLSVDDSTVVLRLPVTASTCGVAAFSRHDRHVHCYHPYILFISISAFSTSKVILSILLLKSLLLIILFLGANCSKLNSSYSI